HPATDIGYLLGKNPNRSQSFSLAFGQAHVFYPIARKEQCTAALLLDIDPVALVRGRRGSSGDSGLLAQYVNDRPYVASYETGLIWSMPDQRRDRIDLFQGALTYRQQFEFISCEK